MRGINDVEAQKRPHTPKPVAHWRLVFSQTLVTNEDVLNYRYKGAGTTEDPYLVEWIPFDPRNPMEWPDWKKWAITFTVAIATLAVSLVASAYSASIPQLMDHFGCSEEVATLGTSSFVLGFAFGPTIWGPLSELYGRQYLYFGTYLILTAFNGAAIGANSIASLIVFRFIGGIFGSSPLTNAGGVIADMFPASQRGLGITLFACAPFLGPALGPLIGGFVAENAGWRWLEAVMALYCATLWIFGSLTVPETYAPVILSRRANQLSKRTGKVYVSAIEHRQGKVTAKEAFNKAIKRPWILLFLEPIVLLLSLWLAILYGTLFLLFGAFPIVFAEGRHWSQGISGLAFLGLAGGQIAATIYCILDNKRYQRIDKEYNGEAPPEVRLPPATIGAIAIPIGMFWFAWTNGPSVHWIVPILACAPFGFGMVLAFLASINYLIDAYTIYAASVLAATAIVRALFAAIFPLFTNYMYARLGIHWASSIPAFLALACTPFPFIFYKYGKSIRMKCKYAADAAEVMAQIRARQKAVQEEEKREADEDAAGISGVEKHAQKVDVGE
ncbi:major facilitator superfamily domain-containing protein [Exophiala viscosa]|nr:major facilitator superfamily domain-containing protein [Exophiala viscosa]